MVTRVNRKDLNFSLILHRIQNHMRKKAYDSVIQSKKNRSGTGNVGKRQCCTRRTPLLRLTLLYRKNRLHYGKRFHTNCYVKINTTCCWGEFFSYTQVIPKLSFAGFHRDFQPHTTALETSRRSTRGVMLSVLVSTEVTVAAIFWSAIKIRTAAASDTRPHFRG